MKTLVCIKKGDKLLYESSSDRSFVVTVLDIVSVPNGAMDPKIVSLIFAKKEDGNIISATSNRFKIIEDFDYEEFYPTPHLFHLEK